MHGISFVVGCLLLISGVVCHSAQMSHAQQYKEKDYIRRSNKTIDQKNINFSDLLLSIQKLIIEDSKIIPSDIVITQKYDSLTRLRFKNCNLTKFDIKSTMASLQELDLSYNQLQEVNFLEILEWSSLQTLNLRDNRIDAIKESSIASFKNILSIDVINNNIREINIRLLCPAHTLGNVYISENVKISGQCDHIRVNRSTVRSSSTRETQLHGHATNNHHTNFYYPDQYNNKEGHKDIKPQSTAKPRPTIQNRAAFSIKDTNRNQDRGNASSQDSVTITTSASPPTTENSNENNTDLLMYIVFPIIITILVIIIIVLICRNRRAKVSSPPVAQTEEDDHDYYATVDSEYYYEAPPIVSADENSAPHEHPIYAVPMKNR